MSMSPLPPVPACPPAPPGLPGPEPPESLPSDPPNMPNNSFIPRHMQGLKSFKTNMHRQPHPFYDRKASGELASMLPNLGNSSSRRSGSSKVRPKHKNASDLHFDVEATLAVAGPAASAAKISVNMRVLL